MKYIRDYKDGDRVFDIYLCKHRQSAVTKNGKPYETVILQDKTGTIDAKIWDPNSAGICEFDAYDYIEVYGDVSAFQNALQISIKRTRKCREGEYNPGDYLPVSGKNIELMYTELTEYIYSIKNNSLRCLLEALFVKDEAFVRSFKQSSAAKSVHHGFVGGLLEHTLSVVKLCDYYCTAYPVLNRDLLLAAAMCHDIGKTKELSPFPANDYTEDGQLLGHIIMGTEMVGCKIREIPGFSPLLEGQLKHCILAHHGEYEYGSPKKPAIIEALALNFADNTDAKIQTFTEVLQGTKETGWLGFNRLFESNLRTTKVDE
ncbi:MAG: HD domain-containing protein [Lachnospiraceae bacterium]|nr:HD domain-containing protein [Lachnospiraceae bacterium]